MPKLLIDRVAPLALPRAIDIAVPGVEEHELPGGQRIYVEETSGVDIELVFGENGVIAQHLKDLELRRGKQGIHMLSFENISCEEWVDLLVYMPKVPRTFAGYDDKQGDYAYGEVTLNCHQINPHFSLAFMEWWLFQSAGYSVADSKFRVSMPAAGRFVSGGLSGYWFDVIGAGAEEIEFQLRNSTQGFDYLSTVGRFKTSTGNQLQDGIFGTNLSFVKDDIIDLDVDEITSGAPAADSAIFVVQAAVELYGR